MARNAQKAETKAAIEEATKRGSPTKIKARAKKRVAVLREVKKEIQAKKAIVRKIAEKKMLTPVKTPAEQMKKAKEIAKLNAKVRKLDRAQKRVGKAINKKQNVIARGGGTLKGAKKRLQSQQRKIAATKAKIATKPAVTPAQQIKKDRDLRALN